MGYHKENTLKEFTTPSDSVTEIVVAANLVRTLLLQNFINSFSKLLYPGQGHSISGVYPKDTGREAGTHPGWDTRTSFSYSDP